MHQVLLDGNGTLFGAMDGLANFYTFDTFQGKGVENVYIGAGVDANTQLGLIEKSQDFGERVFTQLLMKYIR